MQCVVETRWPPCSDYRAHYVSGVDSQGVESDGTTGAPQNAVRFRPATKRMVAPASPARCAVYKEQLCRSLTRSGTAILSDTPITFASISPSCFYIFLFKFYPVAIIRSHNNFAWYPRPFSYIYRYRIKRLVEWRELFTLSESKHRIILSLISLPWSRGIDRV